MALSTPSTVPGTQNTPTDHYCGLIPTPRSPFVGTWEVEALALTQALLPHLLQGRLSDPRGIELSTSSMLTTVPLPAELTALDTRSNAGLPITKLSVLKDVNPLCSLIQNPFRI